MRNSFRQKNLIYFYMFSKIFLQHLQVRCVKNYQPQTVNSRATLISKIQNSVILTHLFS